MFIDCEKTRYLKRVIFSRAVLQFFLLFFASLVFAEPETKPHERLHIRAIRVEVLDIFDEQNIGAIYRGINSLKMSTTEEVVRRELLFKEGDPFDQFRINESGRNLRALPFLRRVSITSVRDGTEVDVLVQVQDAWTLYPFISLSSGGGSERRALGLAEGNIFGLGKQVELLTADEEGRQKIEGLWTDPRVMGTYHRLSIGHFQRSDGDRTFAAFGRPFRSVVESYSWGSDGDAFDLVGRLFEDGEEDYLYRQKHVAFGGAFALSSGDPVRKRRRYYFGYRYTDDQFTQADEEDFEDADVAFDPALNDITRLPENRRFSGPLFALQQIKQDFVSANYIDRFERVEDFDLGNEFNLALQFAGEVFSSLEDVLLLSISQSQGKRLTPTSFLRGALSASSRYQYWSGFEQVLLRAEGKYYNVLGPLFLQGAYLGKHTLAFSGVVDYADDVDRDFEYLLGARSGLRGYSDREFSGEQRMIFNFEDRLHFVEDVLRLVSLGGAFFVDVGGASNQGLGDILTDQLYADFGFGLRFGLTRSSGGNVVRLDVAFPLRDGPDDSGRLEPRILISTGQAFGAGLSTERSSNSAERTSAGYLQ